MSKIESICKKFEIWGWENQEVIIDNKYYRIIYDEKYDNYYFVYYTIIQDIKDSFSFEYSDYITVYDSKNPSGFYELIDCIVFANNFIKNL